jgi:hypothetical protein
VRELQDDLQIAGIRSKLRIREDATPYGGQTLSRGALYAMLQNRIYRGEITHKGNAYAGEHAAIIDQVLWDQVQATLGGNRVQRMTGSGAREPSLLAGLVFDEAGERLTPTHAVKKGTRYRYYASTSLITGSRKANAAGWRVPSANLEGLVIERLRTLLCDPSKLLDSIDEHMLNGIGAQHLMERAPGIAEELTDRTPDKMSSLAMTLVRRVEIGAESIKIEVCRQRLTSVLQGHRPAPGSISDGKRRSRRHSDTEDCRLPSADRTRDAHSRPEWRRRVSARSCSAPCPCPLA